MKRKEVDGFFIKILNSSLWVPRKEIEDMLAGKLPKIVSGKIIIVPSGGEPTDPEPRHKKELIEMFHTYVSGDFAAVIKEAFEEDWNEKPHPLFDFDEMVSAMGGVSNKVDNKQPFREPCDWWFHSGVTTDKHGNRVPGGPHYCNNKKSGNYGRQNQCPRQTCPDYAIVRDDRK